MNAQEIDPIEKIYAVVSKRKRYCVSAYLHTLDALNYLIEKEKRPPGEHITASQLVVSFLALATLRFGPLALCVLKEWQVYETKDIGVLVYDLIDLQLMGKNKEDTQEQFNDICCIRSSLDYNKILQATLKNLEIQKENKKYI